VFKTFGVIVYKEIGNFKLRNQPDLFSMFTLFAKPGNHGNCNQQSKSMIRWSFKCTMVVQQFVII